MAKNDGLKKIFGAKPTFSGRLSSIVPDFIEKPAKKFFEPKPKIRIRDVIREIPSAIKSIFVPQRGFTEKELAEAEPTFKQKLQAFPKLGAEIIAGTITLSGLLGDIIGESEVVQKVAETKVGQKLAELGEREQKFSEKLFAKVQPKTAEEASAFRVADISTLFIGQLRIGRTSAVKIAGSRNPSVIKNILVKEVSGLTDEGADALSRILVQVDNVDDVERVFNRTNFALQKGSKKPVAKPLSLEKKTELSKIFKTKKGVSPRNLKTKGLAQIKRLETELPISKAQDVTDLQTVKAERFGKDIFVSQETITPSKVTKFMEEIQSGEIRDPFVIVKFNNGTQNLRVIDGHNRLVAYQRLGIDNIPVIDASRTRVGGTAIEAVKPAIQTEALDIRVKPEDYQNLLTQLDLAQAGRRVQTESGQFIAERSTFPKFIPEQLRSKKLLDKFLEGRNGNVEELFSIKFKEGSRLEALNKVFKEQLGITDLKPAKLVRSKEIPSLQKTAEETISPETGQLLEETGTSPKTPSSSYEANVIQESTESKAVETGLIKKDPTGLVGEGIDVAPKEDLLTTRNFKQTDEWKAFAKYAEDNLQGKDIRPAITHRHASMTMERVAEFLDGGLHGETYKKIVKPVYKSAEKMAIEGNQIKQEVDSFNVLEGSKIDRDASLFAQKRIPATSQKGQGLARYTRDKYDEFLVRMNEVRAKIGVEPIPKRQDYVTHLNELNVLSELFGSLERVTTKQRISVLKSQLLDQHPDWEDARAFDSAKRQIEGLTGLAKYVDAKQPAFNFAKKRLKEFESDPSLIRSFGAYTQPALRYIHQAENVAKNKAFKDVLPANSKEFTRLWNTEQVAGRQPASFLSPVMRRAVSALRGTLGANTILGNMATTMMQLTSWAQVIALAGPLNTFYGLGKRLQSYIPNQSSLFQESRTKALRNLEIDIGLGNSLIDEMLKKIGKIESLRNPSARTRQAVDLGRNMVMGIMEIADQFTVGATYEAFYRKGVIDGLDPQDAIEFAEIMTGKTQANYFKEALPPFLNTLEGKTLGQFGIYGMNQWEMFKRDFGRDLKFDEQNPKSVTRFFKQFIVFLTSAYIMDSLSEETFGRQPYDVKELVDDSLGFARGEVTGSQLRDTSKESISTYIPFMGSVKFKSAPPVFDFGLDVIQATFGTGKSQEKAIDDITRKWTLNILLPYGGNQTRKSLEGFEATTDLDLPFVKNPSKKFDIETNVDTAKAIIFGPYSTGVSRDYYENRDRRDGIKETFGITGTITSDENIAKLKKMSDEEYLIYTEQYADSTKKTLSKKTGRKTEAEGEISPIQGGNRTLEDIFK